MNLVRWSLVTATPCWQILTVDIKDAQVTYQNLTLVKDQVPSKDINPTFITSLLIVQHMHGMICIIVRCYTCVYKGTYVQQRSRAHLIFSNCYPHKPTRNHMRLAKRKDTKLPRETPCQILTNMFLCRSIISDTFMSNIAMDILAKNPVEFLPRSHDKSTQQMPCRQIFVVKKEWLNDVCDCTMTSVLDCGKGKAPHLRTSFYKVWRQLKNPLHIALVRVVAVLC